MNEPLTDYLDVLSENHMGSRRGDWCTGCGADWPCFERQAIEELRQHRAEGVNHHATACMTCMATESELITLRAELELARATYETTIQADAELETELREQNAKLVTQIHLIADTYRECGMSRETVDAILATAKANDWPDAKGEPPRYGFNCEPGCPGCPNCEGTTRRSSSCW